MNGLVVAVLTGAGLSVLAGLGVWLSARVLRQPMAGAEVALWRTARMVTLLPLILAPIIYAVPQAPMAGPGGTLELGPLPQAVPAVLVQGAQPVEAGTTGLSLTTLLVFAYFAGLVAMLARCGLRHLVRRRLLAHSREASREERRPFERLAQRLDVRAPEMRIGPAGISPFLTGWRGIVVLPDDAAMAPAARHYAMAHELCHLKRGDERDRLIGAALVAVNWFNWPLRQVERELDAAREIACDRDTLEALGGAQRKAYAAALIDMMRIAAPTVSAFGPSNRRLREMRIQAIMTRKTASKGRAVWLTATLLATALPVAGAQALVTERRPAEAPQAELVTPAMMATAAERAPAAPHAVRAEVPAFAPLPAAAVAPDTVPVPAPVPARHADPVHAPAPVAAVAPHLTHAVTEGRITSRYGDRPARPAGAPAFHHGFDIAAERGTPITAPGPGVIVHAAAGYRGEEAWGNTVAIDHGNGWQTVYAHMEGFDVRVGDQVMAGEQIGRIGATGRVTGPHVHVELHHNGERVDPTGQVPGLD